jgi:integrase
MSGSLPIDVQVGGIRIARRSGTRIARQRDAYVRMVKHLGEVGRTDYVQALAAGTVSFAALWPRYRAGQVATLPSPELFWSLSDAWDRWLTRKRKLGAHSRRNYRAALQRLQEIDPNASIADLPRVVQQHADLSADPRPAVFNADRRAVLSFLGTTVGRYHPLYGDVHRIEPLPVLNKRPINPQTPEQIRELTAWLQSYTPRGGRLPASMHRRGERHTMAHHARTVWALCLTGMRPEEYWEELVGDRKNEWELLPDRVQIRGTKGEAAMRDVPRLAIITKPATGQLAFRRALNTACKALGIKHLEPYDFRRSYGVWLDNAGIPDNRQDAYMAHGPQNMRALYRRPGDLTRWLADDREALSRYIGLIADAPRLRVVK